MLTRRRFLQTAAAGSILAAQAQAALAEMKITRIRYYVRIPGQGNHDSGLKVITIPG